MNIEELKQLYHSFIIILCFVRRYRRKIFLNSQVEERFKTLVREICDELEIEILAMECDQDHVHLLLNTLPTFSPTDIMAKIKGVTSKS